MNIKLLNELAKVPTKTNDYDAGYDLYSIENITIPAYERVTIKTGISLAIPNHCVGLIWPRSGLSVKKGIDVLAGVIDSTYRGEIMVCLLNTSNIDMKINIGDRIAQIIFQEYNNAIFQVVEELDNTTRGDKGFGSSDEIPF